MSDYDIEIQGKQVKTTVIDNAAFLDSTISQINWFSSPRRIVGVDVKYHFSPRASTPAVLCILCVEDRCLIIQLYSLNPIPESFKNFLLDESICFVHMGLSSILGCFYYCVSKRQQSVECKTSVRLGNLAEKVLKKPNLNIASYSLEDLAREVGVDSVRTTELKTAPNWCARVFTDEEVKYAIHEAYTCYCVGNKLLSMVNV